MWSPERRNAWIHSWTRPARLAGALASAALLGGCFEPLYGERSLTGGPGLRQRMAAVDVVRIEVPNGTPVARIANEVRNDLIFDLQGGSGGPTPTHQLRINLATSNQQVIVDITTARADVQQYGIDATYSLVEKATGKSVVTGQTFARVSYDNPGQAQRFSNARGQRDAENRAARTISENIKARLASYFSAGA
jgi:LPS-assembly lipoprotein